MVERAANLSDEILDPVGVGRQIVVDAVRKFVNTLEEQTPALGDPSQRKAVIDATVNLTDELSKALIELMRSVTSGAGEALTPGRDKKE